VLRVTVPACTVWGAAAEDGGALTAHGGALNCRSGEAGSDAGEHRVCTMCGEAAEIVGAMESARGALHCRRREEAHSTAEAVVLVLMFGGIFRAFPSRARSAFLRTLRLASYSRLATLCLSATPT
jgi:hypothetical protein